MVSECRRSCPNSPRASLSGLVFYERIVVPLLPSLKSVSLWWWILATSPLWIVAVVIGLVRTLPPSNRFWHGAEMQLGWQVYNVLGFSRSAAWPRKFSLSPRSTPSSSDGGTLVSAILLGVRVASWVFGETRARPDRVSQTGNIGNRINRNMGDRWLGPDDVCHVRPLPPEGHGRSDRPDAVRRPPRARPGVA